MSLSIKKLDSNYSVKLIFTLIKPFFLCLDGVQNEVLNSGIKSKDLVPNTPTSTQISVTGEKYLIFMQFM